LNSGFRLWKKIRINSHNTNTPPKLPQIIKDFLGTISVLVSISEIVSVFIANTGRKKMFMTSTDWEFADADAMTQAGHDMWAQIKSAGAISFKAAQTGDNTARTVIIWPDAATAGAAIENLRAAAASMTDTKVIGSAMGELMVDYE
jgi:hypothetical protein